MHMIENPDKKSFKIRIFYPFRRSSNLLQAKTNPSNSPQVNTLRVSFCFASRLVCCCLFPWKYTKTEAFVCVRDILYGAFCLWMNEGLKVNNKPTPFYCRYYVSSLFTSAFWNFFLQRWPFPVTLSAYPFRLSFPVTLSGHPWSPIPHPGIWQAFTWIFKHVCQKL